MGYVIVRKLPGYTGYFKEFLGEGCAFPVFIGSNHQREAKVFASKQEARKVIRALGGRYSVEEL
jgi:hypothetical protein